MEKLKQTKRETVLERHSFSVLERDRENVLVKIVLLCEAKRSEIWNYILFAFFQTFPE